MKWVAFNMILMSMLASCQHPENHPVEFADRVDELEMENEDLRREISDLEDKINRLESSISDLENRISDVEDEIQINNLLLNI